MKKAILFLGAILFAISSFSQFTPTGTLLTDAKFRSGAIGIGYTTAPTFGTKKFMVNGEAYISSSLQIGTANTYSTSLYGLKMDKSFQIISDNGSHIELAAFGGGTSSSRSMNAIAHTNGSFTTLSISGDVLNLGNTPKSFIIGNEFNGNIKFATGLTGSTSKIQMMIDNKGNIGIGTGSTALNPLEKLAVNGLIHTKEVKVDLLNWPDFVFESNYSLMPLDELEKQITANKHLPEIPSATEVAENGVLLGEMNKKLLQKVEELTLYMIQMNKEIELLKTNAKN